METDPVPHRWFRLFQWEAEPLSAVVLPVSRTDLNLGSSLPSSLCLCLSLSPTPHTEKEKTVFIHVILLPLQFIAECDLLE